MGLLSCSCRSERAGNSFAADPNLRKKYSTNFIDYIKAAAIFVGRVGLGNRQESVGPAGWCLPPPASWRFAMSLTSRLGAGLRVVAAFAALGPAFIPLAVSAGPTLDAPKPRGVIKVAVGSQTRFLAPADY